jgi:hypothetical protein
LNITNLQFEIWNNLKERGDATSEAKSEIRNIKQWGMTSGIDSTMNLLFGDLDGELVSKFEIRILYLKRKG